MYGQILIPGPQGVSSSSLANFSGIMNATNSTLYIYFDSGNINYINITPSETTNPNDTYTFGLTGKYLFQYNIFLTDDDDFQTTIEFFGTVGGVASTSFGSQTALTSGSYGCSIIKDMNVGDFVSLRLTTQIDWNFASITIIKL